MKTLILGTALSSLFALNAARAQTPAQDKRTVDLVWNAGPGMTNALSNVSLEYASKKTGHMVFGAGAFYNRSTVSLNLGTNAFDFRDKHYFAIRPTASAVFANEGKEDWMNEHDIKTVRGFKLGGSNKENTVLCSILFGTDAVFGRATGIFNGAIGVRYEVGNNFNSAWTLTGGVRVSVNNTVKAVKKLKH